MQNSGLMMGTFKYLRAPVLANVRAGMKLQVLTDTAHDSRVWQVVMSTLTEIGADAVLSLFDPRPADYYDPPQAVCEAMTKVDLNILLTSTGMLHCQANHHAMKAGVPVICMDGGMTLEMFQSGAATEDLQQLEVRQHYVATRIFGKDARVCRVTSKFGSDLTYRVDGRIFVPSCRAKILCLIKSSVLTGTKSSLFSCAYTQVASSTYRPWKVAQTENWWSICACTN
jgi:2,5-dihydroxypyridine 5,6-dioxygenase